MANTKPPTRQTPTPRYTAKGWGVFVKETGELCWNYNVFAVYPFRDSAVKSMASNPRWQRTWVIKRVSVNASRSKGKP